MVNTFATRYRPRNLDDMVLLNRIRVLFEGKKLEQNYLFHSGPPGMGKTTLCKILHSNYDTLEVAASEDGRIDTIRNDVRSFASSGSIMNGKYREKVVFFDEVDGASEKFFQAFRSVAEDEILSKNVMYLATCNDFNKIPEAVQSRFSCVNFLPENKEEEKEYMIGYAKRINKIAKLNGINFDKEVLKSFVKKGFPDMRSMLNSLQNLQISGITNPTLDDVSSVIYEFNDIYEALFSPNTTDVIIYQEFSKKYGNVANDVIDAMWSNFIKWILDNQKEEVYNKIGYIVREIADHKARARMMDPVLNMLSCIYTIHEIINE